MGKIGFRLIFLAVIVGGIFLIGFIAGGSFGSGMAMNQLEECLPAESVEELQPCASGDQP